MKRTRTQSNLSTRLSRRAFSLAELMVAVGILGIGMIMVAMAFPVALDQSRQAAELATSQLVYNDAVNKLKTRIKWTQLEAYMNPEPFAGAHEYNPALTLPYYDLVPRDIYMLSFDGVETDPTGAVYDFFQNPVMSNEECVYSADDTYGWVAAVQKLNNQTYKFWIFILREPKGMMDGGIFRAGLEPVRILTPTLGKTLTFTPAILANFDLARGDVLLDDRGTLFKIMDIGEPDGAGNVTVMLDKELPVGWHTFAHVTGDGFTRKNPVLTVYQTVISY